MSIDQYLSTKSPNGQSAIAIGVFDGMHLGHRYLMSRLCEEAQRAGLLSGVVTFCNHPASVLRPGFNAEYLTSLDERISLVLETGVDFVVPLTFDEQLRLLTAGDFSRLLKEHLKMSMLVAGKDFVMGRDREGDTSVLSEIGSQMDFRVLVVDSVANNCGSTIRSTVIRNALAAGRVEQANESLGRNFALVGTVSRGYGLGAAMEFPTANLKIHEGLAIPKDGIYAGWAWVGGCRYMAATSIGVRPTFGLKERSIEAFILDFDGDLYDKKLRLEFVSRLRDEVKFDSAESLKEQMVKDVNDTRCILRRDREVKCISNESQIL